MSAIPTNAPPSGQPSSSPSLGYSQAQPQTATIYYYPHQPSQVGRVQYETPEQTAQRNASVPFLKIRDASGNVVAYAEYGRIVPVYIFQSDIAGNRDYQEAESQYYPRETATPASRESLGGYIYDGKTFENAIDLEMYVRSQYPGATVTPRYAGEDLGLSRSAGLPPETITGFEISKTAVISTKSQPTPESPTGIIGIIERDAGAIYSGIQSGFRSLFIAGASTGRFVASGGRDMAVNLTQEQSQRLDTVTSIAAYLVPGTSVFKGIGSVDEPPAARVFDVAVGILPFAPAISGAGRVARIATSLPGRVAIGATVGIAGGLAYGESPEEIGVSAVVGGLGFAVVPGLGRAGATIGKSVMSSLSGVKESTEEFLLRQGVVQPRIYNPALERPSQETIDSIKNSFNQAETGEAAMTQAELTRSLNSNLPQFRFRQFSEPSTGPGEYEIKSGQGTSLIAKQETKQIQESLTTQKQLLRQRVKVSEEYRLDFLATPELATRQSQSQSLRQQLGLETKSMLKVESLTATTQIHAFDVAYQFKFAQAQDVSFKFSQQQVQKAARFPKSIISLNQVYSVEQLAKREPLIPSFKRTRQISRHRGRARYDVFIRPNQLSFDILGESLPFDIKGFL